MQSVVEELVRTQPKLADKQQEPKPEPEIVLEEAPPKKATRYRKRKFRTHNVDPLASANVWPL